MCMKYHVWNVWSKGEPNLSLFKSAFERDIFEKKKNGSQSVFQQLTQWRNKGEKELLSTEIYLCSIATI